MSGNNVYSSEIKSAAAAATNSIITDLKDEDAIVSNIKGTISTSIIDAELTNYRNQLWQKEMNWQKLKRTMLPYSLLSNLK